MKGAALSLDRRNQTLPLCLNLCHFCPTPLPLFHGRFEGGKFFYICASWKCVQKFERGKHRLQKPIPILSHGKGIAHEHRNGRDALARRVERILGE